MWKRVGKGCWKRLRAPSVKWLWEARDAWAVLEFLEDTRVGCWSLARGMIGPEERGYQESERERGRLGLP